MSKLDNILGENVAYSSGMGGEPIKRDMNAKKKQAIKDLMLELIASDATFTDIYGDDYRNNYGYPETQVRDAARWLQRRLRQKIEAL